MKAISFIVLIFFACFTHCSLNKNALEKTKNEIIALQPLDTFDRIKIEAIKNDLSEFWQRKVIVLPIQAIPEKYFRGVVEAYSSDSILSFLSAIKHDDLINIVAITHKTFMPLRIAMDLVCHILARAYLGKDINQVVAV